MLTDEKDSRISLLILRAFTFIRESEDVVFVGIYSTENFKLLAAADRDKVAVNPTKDSDEMAVNIHRLQVQAIITHIRTPDNVLAQLNIANLHFLCLRNGTGNMTGMSNFNMDIKRDSVHEVNNTLYRIAKDRYSANDLIEGVHALQISAVLKEQFIIIGLNRAGKESSLKILKDILDEAKRMPELKKDLIPHTKSGNKLNEIKYPVVQSDSVTSEISNLSYRDSSVFTYPVATDEPVEIRPPKNGDDVRRRDQQKRETSFCEDWRTATMESIQALRMIGPFADDNISDGDDRPLVLNIESQATSDIGVNTAQKHEHRASSVNSGRQCDSGSRDSVVLRRPSRATMV